MTKRLQLGLLMDQDLSETPAFVKQLTEIVSDIEKPVSWAWLESKQQFIIELLNQSDSDLAFSTLTAKVVKQQIKAVWEHVRRVYFRNYFLDELLQTSSHVLNPFLTSLEKGIASHEVYLSFEEQWTSQVLPFCEDLSDDFSNLARLALSKFYTGKKNDYYDHCLRLDIQQSSKNPFYTYAHFLEAHDLASSSFYSSFEEATRQIEALIFQQNEQYRKRLFSIIKGYYLSIKQSYYKQKGVTSSWQMVVEDVQIHSEWASSQQILQQLLPEQLESAEAFKDLMNLFQTTTEQRQAELGFFNFHWVQKEFEKRLRLLEKRLRLLSENQFATWLKALRESHGLSYRQLEHLSGVSSTYLHRLESGAQKCPTIPTAKKIAQAFGIPFEEIAKFVASDLTGELPVGEQELDLLKLLAVKPLTIGTVSLNKKQRQSLTQLLSLITTETFDSDRLSDTMELLNLIKEIQKK